MNRSTPVTSGYRRRARENRHEAGTWRDLDFLAVREPLFNSSLTANDSEVVVAWVEATQSEEGAGKLSPVLGGVGDAVDRERDRWLSVIGLLHFETLCYVIFSNVLYCVTGVWLRVMKR